MDKRELLKQKRKELQEYDEAIKTAASALYKAAIAYEPNQTFTIGGAKREVNDCQVILLDSSGPSVPTPNGIVSSSTRTKILMFKEHPIYIRSTEENGRQDFCETMLKLCKTKNDLLLLQKATLTLV